MLEGIQPVISVAQNAIKDILNETQPVPVTIEKIVGEVSRTFNVSPPTSAAPSGTPTSPPPAASPSTSCAKSPA